jgi:Septum formation
MARWWRSGSAEPGKHEPDARGHRHSTAKAPLFQHGDGRRRLTVWPDGTLEGTDGWRKKRISLVGAEEISVSYEGHDLPVLQRRGKVFAQQTVVRVRDRLGKTTQMSLQWAIPLEAKQQLEEVVAGFAGKVPVSLAAAGARLLASIAPPPPFDQTSQHPTELRKHAARLQAPLAADPEDAAALAAARCSPRAQAALRDLTTAIHHRAELDPAFHDELAAFVREAEQNGPSRWLDVVAGAGLGLTTAAVGAIGWYLAVINDQPAAILLAAVGVLVGKTVVLGSGGARSRSLQLISVGLTLSGLIASQYLLVRHDLTGFVAEQGSGTLPVLLSPDDALAAMRDSLEANRWLYALNLVLWGVALWPAWWIPAPRPGSGQGLRLPAATSRVWHVAGLAAGTVVLAGLGVSLASMDAADAGVGIGVDQLRIGQCFQQPAQDQIQTVEVVPCTQPHDAEVFAVAPLRGQELPAEAELERVGVEACEAGFRSYVGVAAHESELDFGWLVPTTEAWASGDRTIVCALEYPDDRSIVGSMRGTAVKNTPELRTFKVARTVNVGAFRIRVTQLTCGYVELAELPPAERGQYCVAQLVVWNRRSYPEWLYFEEQRLLVASGDSFEGYGLGNLLWDDDLDPGQSVTTRLVFDLPKGLWPVELQLQGYTDQDWTQTDSVTIKLPRR